MAENKVFGYVRVSSKDQNEARQVEDILNLGVCERDIYIDKASGKDFNRLKYQALKAQLRREDTVIIKSLDRLGRNFKQISDEWHELTEVMGVYIKVIDQPELNTDNKSNGLMGEVIAKIVFILLSYVAEQERAFNKQRRDEGIVIAKAKGKYKKNKIEAPENFKELFNKAVEGGRLYTHTMAMKELKLNKTTYYRIAKECGLRTEKRTIAKKS